ncbi:MAG: Asp23/Gls24 family envelope stress response protein [Pseudonocardia sp.]|nr:Asp23/Gls24 family envelope stress response protein [Pseudonocardia sp.]
MALDPSAAATGPGADEQIEPLACGRDAAVVWDHAADGMLDEHERGCPHCAAAIADAHGLDGVVHRMAQEQPLPPPSLMDTVMEAVLDTVTAELRPQDLLALDSPAGPARLSRPAAARVLRHAVDRMDGMRARSCRIEQDGVHLTVAITVTARFGVDLASVTARVRQMVVAAGEQALGAPVARVDITVVDLWDEP